MLKTEAFEIEPLSLTFLREFIQSLQVIAGTWVFGLLVTKNCKMARTPWPCFLDRRRVMLS
jgi:hypothetical protein